MSYLNRDLLLADTDQRLPRKRQLIRAEIVASAHISHPIIIRNVSESGIGCIAPGLLLQKGEKVTVRFREDIVAEGTVAWFDGERFGIQMQNELDLAFLTDMICKKQIKTSEEDAWEVRRIHKVQTPRLETGSIRRI